MLNRQWRNGGGKIPKVFGTKVSLRRLGYDRRGSV